MQQKLQFSGDSRFSFAWCHPSVSFLATSLSFLLEFEEKNPPLNSANFSTSDSMDETNFPDPSFSGLGLPFGVVDIWWV